MKGAQMQTPPKHRWYMIYDENSFAHQWESAVLVLPGEKEPIGRKMCMCM